MIIKSKVARVEKSIKRRKFFLAGPPYTLKETMAISNVSNQLELVKWTHNKTIIDYFSHIHVSCTSIHTIHDYIISIKVIAFN